MSFQLTIAEGKEAGKEFVFDQASVTIGRTSDCDVILYDPGVSRKHARIFTEGDTYFVEDMGSSNGTKVNGAVVKKVKLNDGDAVALGPVVFKFAPAAVEDLPTAAPKNGVAEQSTRIVAADQVKRQRNKGQALLPENASDEDLENLKRTSTTAMQAVRRNSAPNVPAARRPTPPPPGEGAMSRSAMSAERAPARPAPARTGGPLSAAERARIRRESKGMAGNLRIFWLEASPIVRALVSLVLLVIGAGVLGGGYWFITRPDNAGPAHPEPVMLSPRPIEESFGLGDGVTWNRPDMKVFTFEFNAPVRAVVLIHYQAKDISQGEVSVTVNGVDVGQVPADTLASNQKSHEIIVPFNVLKKGEVNQVIFDNTRNPPGKDPWRVWNVWVETSLLPDVPQDMLIQEARHSFERAQLEVERRDVGAENRYLAWKDFRSAWLYLEATPDPKPELYVLARDKVKEAQQELDRTCSKLLLEEEGYYNQHDFQAARATLDHIKSYFPGTDQPCALLGEQKRAEHQL